MPFLQPNQQRQSTEGNELRHFFDKNDMILFSHSLQEFIRDIYSILMQVGHGKKTVG